MKKIILLALIMAFLSCDLVLAEEIKYSAIVPNQTIVRTRKVVVGDDWRSKTATPDDTIAAVPGVSPEIPGIPNDSLIINGSVGIRTKTPAAALDVGGDAIIVPRHPGPEMPSTGLVEGMICYDLDDHAFKGWDGTGWVILGRKSIFGAYDNTYVFSLETNGVVINTTDTHVYTAETDGIVMACIFMNASFNNYIVGYADSDNASTKVAVSSTGYYNVWASITFPVKRGDKWKVVCDQRYSLFQSGFIYWLPIE